MQPYTEVLGNLQKRWFWKFKVGVMILTHSVCCLGYRLRASVSEQPCTGFSTWQTRAIWKQRISSAVRGVSIKATCAHQRWRSSIIPMIYTYIYICIYIYAIYAYTIYVHMCSFLSFSAPGSKSECLVASGLLPRGSLHPQT